MHYRQFPVAPSSSGFQFQQASVTQPNEYDVAIAAMKHHFSLVSNVVVERHWFHHRYQQPGESVANSVVALRDLASAYSFSPQDDALRDQFAAIVSSNRISVHMLLEGSALSFTKAVQVTMQFEQAAEELGEFSVLVQPVLK
ncbi:hypothetical protein HPB50_002009 [Hyalomma asiaticum]|uniref:Uncharacterized protein n=1 Tax=Hyalomma asiaticum TaxID=266040 RepID=A0ACB7RXI3_HYAAI|nr:hypothetical protein HPB50_002009 [Hyalomma asiaticum]